VCGNIELRTIGMPLLGYPISEEALWSQAKYNCFITAVMTGGGKGREPKITASGSKS
jgi:hypothetical protein